MSSEFKITFSDKMNKYQYDGHAHEIPITNPKKTAGKLFLGDRDSCSMVQLLHRNVKCVVNAQGDMHGLSKEDTIKYLKLDPVDNNKSCFELAYRFIDTSLDAGNNVLVCCHSGLGKSAAIVLYYVMKKLGLSFADSHRLVEAERIGIRSDSKTSGFRPDLVRILLEFERELNKSQANTVRLDDRIMEYCDGKGLLGSGAGSADKVYKGSSRDSPSRNSGASGFHVLAVVVVLIAVLYGALYVITGKA